MAIEFSPSASLPLIRALDKFAGGLAAVGRGMDKGNHGGIGSLAAGMAVPAMQKDWGGMFRRLSDYLGAASKKYMGQAAQMAGPKSIRENDLLDEAMGVAKPAEAEGGGDKLSLARKALGGFTSIASKATGALTKFSTVTATASAVIAAGKKVPGVGQLANLGEAGFGMIGKRLTSDFSAMLVPLGKFNSQVETLTVGLTEAGKASHAYSDAVGSTTGAIAGAAQGFMQSVGEALSNPVAGLPALVGVVRPFVAAFNPYALIQFDEALQTVYAVIGESLVPVVKMAASVLREFAGYLRPVMKQLEPIFAQIAGLVGDFLKDLMPEIAKFAAEMVPLLQKWLDQMRESIGGQKEMMKAGLLYATGQIGLLEYLKRGLFNWLSKLPIIGGMFAPSANEAAEGVDKNLVPKENLFKFGAPTNPTFKGAESLGRDTLQAAYAAMPDMEKKKEQVDLLAEIAANTKRTADNLKGSGFDANTYDSRVKAGRENPGVWNTTVGAAQWGVGQATEGIYNFGVGVGNLFRGKNFTDSMVDI